MENPDRSRLGSSQLSSCELDSCELRENIAAVRARMADAAARAGRRAADIRLCAASKLHDADTVRLAAGLDIDIFGENHVQELVQKRAAGAYLDKPLHFIGHLQTNKVRQVVGAVQLIQSVDSAHLLAALEKQAARLDICQDILLEVNIAGEESKSGVEPAALPALLETAAAAEHLRVLGLMAVPPADTDDATNRAHFAAMRRLFADCADAGLPHVEMRWLSMGMSGDFENAILEGANLVRVGTAIFGARNYNT